MKLYLCINNITSNDYGNYTCIFDSASGNSNVTVTLVKGKILNKTYNCMLRNVFKMLFTICNFSLPRLTTFVFRNPHRTSK